MKDETNKTLSSELNSRVEQKDKMQHCEEEKKLLAKEVDCLKRELNDKSKELNNERSRVENLIRNEQVSNGTR